MKTKAFSSSILLLIIVMAMAFPSFVTPDDPVTDVVTIRVREGGLGVKSAIHVVENGEERSIVIDGFNQRQDPVKNFKVISELLSEYIKTGYTIESATTSSMGFEGTTTLAIADYVLVR